MTPETTSAAIPVASVAPARSPLPLRIGAGLLALMGAVVAVASVSFSVISPPQHLDAPDWAVAAWAFAIAIGMLWTVPRLLRGEPAAGRVALALLAGHLAFGMVKLVAYHESAALPFMALDLIIAALLTTRSVRAFFRRRR